MHTKRRITTNLKSINNQKHQKNQTAWNSNNQGIKEKINENNQTSMVVNRPGWLAEKNLSKAVDLVGRAGCGEAVGCMGRADLRGNPELT